MLLDAGAPVHVVAARCGHDPATLLRSYAKRTKKADTSAAAIIGNISRTILGRKKTCLVPSWSQFVLFSQFVLSRRTDKPLILLRRRGGRVVEGTSLENWQRRKAFVGSNPTLSANYLFAVVRWHST